MCNIGGGVLLEKLGGAVVAVGAIGTIGVAVIRESITTK